MATWSVICFCVVATSAKVGGQELYDDSPTVKLPQGTLRGGSTETADGTKYYRFLGIPYARPPVGNLRFAAPKDPESWSGVRDATNFRSICHQVKGGSEDCLFVNVFTPKLPTSRSDVSLLPVMVYIHGGAFVTGSGNISPGQLINHGLVVASINYRLNVFGFLSVNGTDAPGNAGLKDQSAALRWVQKNIEKFGGDPKSITIFGMSAGGASIHYNILSPLSKGLFQRAISESGSALNPWAFIKNTEAHAYRLSAVLGKEAHNSLELLRNLRAASVNELASGITKVLTAEENVRLISNPFVPSLEFPRSGEQPFLPHEPAYIEQHGLFNQVPYITGVTKREGASFVTEKMMSQASYWQGINNDLEQVVPVALGLAKGSQKSKEVAQKVKSFYFGNKAISYENRELWISLQTDLLFVTGVTQTVHTHARHSASHTYNYQFVYGYATHGMEYMFVVYNGKMQGESSNAVKLARILGGLWTSFAKTGVPSVEGVAAWKPVTSQASYPYLEISLTPALKYNLEKERMDFWEKIYNEYGKTTTTLHKKSSTQLLEAYPTSQGPPGRPKKICMYQALDGLAAFGLPEDSCTPKLTLIFRMAYWSVLFFCILGVSAKIGGGELYDDSPTVKLSQGTLRGGSTETADGTKYYRFLGIPYARPPVGNLRFATPRDPESWSGVRNATNFGSICHQVKGGSEDCLFVNVFTPKLPTSRSDASLLPVMVYIHGGAFVTGSGNIPPGQLINHGLVVASINYRLNVFGFLSVNGTDAPGNAGLKDQSAALRWVQKNIAKFSGDPNNVTIFGESAGGASVHYNVLSPLSKGLFQRAISESGSALNPWAFIKNTEAHAYRLSAVLGKRPTIL
ncbi:esterase E4-like [Bacillus rossius redtenbacheri]|uniref:esterase E4-like n=1 Tax=Bacillus rossius redtenbacheri TaxID=93214 RepID=UPI002FDC8EA2